MSLNVMRPILCRLIVGCLLGAGCVVSVPASAQDEDRRGALAQEMRSSLQHHLLGLWYPRSVDEEHGGFLSRFSYDWNVLDPQPKMIVTQARHVWTTAQAHRFLGDTDVDYLGAAENGYRFLRDVMWDAEHGGFYALVTREGEVDEREGRYNRGKTAYGNAFAIYGLAAYYEASGDTAALQLAQRTFQWLDDHAHDTLHGGYYQSLRRDGTPVTTWRDGVPPKDQNSSIHLLEAFTALYGVWPDSLLGERLHEMLTLVRDTMVTEPGYLHLYFEVDWTPVSFRDSSRAVQEAHYYLDHISFGHDVETAFLMLEAAHALGIDEGPTLEVGKRMVDHALDQGWDEQRGGFYDGGYYVGAGSLATVVRDAKAWWSQAEGLNALLLMADYFPDDERPYFERFETMWTYVQTYLIDREHGGWYRQGIDTRPGAKRAPKGDVWKATYHNARALMECIRRLEER